MDGTIRFARSAVLIAFLLPALNCGEDTPSGPSGRPLGSIVFAATDSDTCTGRPSVCDQFIARIDLDGTGYGHLSSGPRDIDPSPSPDGRKVVFTRFSSLYVVNADGTGEAPLGAETGFSPAWSPDGSRIAFSSTRSGVAQVYLVNADGSGASQVTRTLDGALEPTWSPDGARIAYTGSDGNSVIHVIAVDGGLDEALTPSSSSATTPAWSPDGTRIAYARHLDVDTDILLMAPDGSGKLQLTAGDTIEQDPSWFPDGEWLLLIAGGRIASMRRTGSDLQLVTTPPNLVAEHPRWLPGQE